MLHHSAIPFEAITTIVAGDSSCCAILTVPVDGKELVFRSLQVRDCFCLTTNMPQQRNSKELYLSR